MFLSLKNINYIKLFFFQTKFVTAYDLHPSDNDYEQDEIEDYGYNYKQDETRETVDYDYEPEIEEAEKAWKEADAKFSVRDFLSSFEVDLTYKICVLGILICLATKSCCCNKRESHRIQPHVELQSFNFRLDDQERDMVDDALGLGLRASRQKRNSPLCCFSCKQRGLRADQYVCCFPSTPTTRPEPSVAYFPNPPTQDQLDRVFGSSVHQAYPSETSEVRDISFLGLTFPRN